MRLSRKDAHMSAAAEMWKDFNVAMVGGLAALVGLLIVAMSVNIASILKAPQLPSRAAGAIATLAYALVVSALGLVPAHPLWLYGAEAAIGLAVLGGLLFQALRAVADEQEVSGRIRAVKAAIILLPPVVYAIGAVMLIFGSAAGLTWFGAGAVLTVISGVAFAWIVLIEIRR